MYIKTVSSLLVIAAASTAQAVTVNLMSTIDSDVLLDVGGSAIGSVTSGDLTPAFTGGLVGDLDLAGVGGSTFTISGNPLENVFSIAGDVFGTTGGVTTSVVTSNIDFFASSPSVLTLTPHGSIADRFILSGVIELTANSGSITANSGLGSIVKDFGTTPTTVSPTLNADSFMDIEPGTTNVTLAVIRFDPQNIYTETIGPFSATLDISSVASIELSAVPEPAHAAFALGAAVLGMIALQRRRR